MFKKIYIICLYIIVGLSLSYPNIDPDLGWHIKYGEFLIKHATLITSDIFSWSMNGYNWYYVSWIFDGFVYLLFNYGGFFALSIGSIIIILFTYYFSFKSFKLSIFWKLIFSLIFIYFFQPVTSAGFRAQLVDLLMIALLGRLMFEISKHDQYKKAIWFPIIVILWNNIHGTFIIGLFMIFVFTASELLRSYINKKPINSLLVISSIFCIPAVFINPYGIKVIDQLTNFLPGQKIEGVNEWLPVSFFSELWLMMFVWTCLLVWIILKRRRSTQGFYEAFIALLFAYLAFKYRRMMSLYFIASLPVVLTYLSEINPLNKIKNEKLIVALIIFITIVNTAVIKLSQNKYLNYTLQDYCMGGAGCSIKAIDYLRKNPLPDRSFNDYNIGGVTIWQNDKSKVFVDGRMHLWKQGNYSAYEDSHKILFEDDIPLFEKYQFNAVYIPSNVRLASYLRRQSRIGKWKIAFEDEKAIIFIRNKQK